MRTVSVRLVDLQNVRINLGFVGENEHTLVRFDCKKVFKDYPDAIPSLAVLPPKGDDYPVVVTRDGDFVEWTVTDSDLIYDGDGGIQLTFTDGTEIQKTYKCKTVVHPSIGGNGTIPTPIENWVEQANEKLAAVEAATEAAESAAEHMPYIGEDGYWYEWNGTVYVKSFKAQGEDGAPGQKGDKGDPGIPGDPTQLLDDDTPSSSKAYSSAKVEEELTDVKTAIDGIHNGTTTPGGSINKLDPEAVETGKQLKTDGTLSDNENYNCSGFIEVTQGKTYLAITGHGASDPTIRNIKDIYRAVFYNENKQFLGAGTKNSDKTITIPSTGNPAYVRFSLAVSTGDWSRDLMAEFVNQASDISEVFVPYSEGGSSTMGLDALAELGEEITTATASDEGKALSPKTVEDGKVVEWQFVSVGGGSCTVDSELSTSSTNPVQNKVVAGKIGEIVDGKTETSSVNHLDPSAIKIGKQLKSDGTLSDNADYTVSGFIPVVTEKAYVIATGRKTSNPSQRNGKTVYRVCFYDSNKDFVSYTSTQGTNKEITIPQNVAYLRISQGNTQSEYWWNLDPMVEFIDNISEISSVFVPYGYSKHTMGIDELNEVENTSKHEITLVAVNCGAFNHVETGDTTTDEEFKANWRNAFNGTKADLFALSDCPKAFGQLQDDSNVVLFGDTIKSFMNNNTFGYGLALASRLKAEFVESLDVGGGETAWRKTVYKFKATISGKDVYIYVGHYQPEEGSAYVDIRATQYANVIADAATNEYEYVIFCGDFNAWNISEYAPFTAAGYKMCNGGYTGVHNTLRTICADNIIYSSNMVEKSFEVLTGLHLNTDHCPIVATLAILPE